MPPPLPQLLAPSNLLLYEFAILDIYVNRIRQHVGFQARLLPLGIMFSMPIPVLAGIGTTFPVVAE